MDKSLLQEEADQGGLVVRVPQGSQALEDARDSQVVMSVAVNDKQTVQKVNQKNKKRNIWCALLLLACVCVKLKLIAHLFKFWNRSSQFDALLTFPVSSSHNTIP